MNKLVNYARLLVTRPIWFSRLVISRLLIYSRLCLLMTVNLDDIYRIRFFPNRYSADLWFPGRNIFDFYKLPFLREGDTVIDVGANIGITALLFRSYVGVSGRVMAFEPHPRTFGYLKSNITLNEITNIDCFNMALGDSQRDVVLSDQGKRDTCNAITTGDAGAIVVSMRTLDEVAAQENVGRVRLIKIDCEGFESSVLGGASNTLERTDFLIVEAIENNLKKYGGSTQAIYDLLTESGFYVFMFHTIQETFVPFELQEYLTGNAVYLYDIFATRDPSWLGGMKWV